MPLFQKLGDVSFANNGKNRTFAAENQGCLKKNGIKRRK